MCEASKTFPLVKVTESGNGWLYRSAIAKPYTSTSTAVLVEAFIREQVFSIQVREWSGHRMLLTFPSKEEMNSMLGGSWLYNWFEEIHTWKPGEEEESARVVWIRCYGVPLNLWNANTFLSIEKG